MDKQLQPHESQEQYLWRLGNNKESLGLTWFDIANLMNKNFQDEDSYITESAYRKKYSAAKQFYDEVFSKECSQSDVNQETLRELERAKQKLRDERAAYNKQNRDAARVDANFEYLAEKLREVGRAEFKIDSSPTVITSDKDMILLLSDWHLGECFDSFLGQYNSDIARERINKFLNKAIEIGKFNGVENVYCALLGDQISGNNHLSIQVSNRENLIDQVKLVSELIASFIVSLSEHFKTVNVYGIAGNHSRMIADKNKDIKDERLDSLCTWIVARMTDHINNIFVYCENLDSTVTKMIVRGKDYVLTHGDMTGTNDSDISKLVLALGEFPYAILCGHRHTPMFKEFNNVKMIQSGSLASAGDDYTVTKRLAGKASQTILIVDNNGIQSVSNIELS